MLPTYSTGDPDGDAIRPVSRPRPLPDHRERGWRLLHRGGPTWTIRTRLLPHTLQGL